MLLINSPAYRGNLKEGAHKTTILCRCPLSRMGERGLKVSAD